jgi:hypothetical protein
VPRVASPISHVIENGPVAAVSSTHHTVSSFVRSLLLVSRNGREDDCVELPVKGGKKKSFKSVTREDAEGDKDEKETDADAESSTAPKKSKSEEKEAEIKKEDEEKQQPAEKMKMEEDKSKEKENESEQKPPPEDDPEAKERAAKRAAKKAAAEALAARDAQLPADFRYDVPPPPQYVTDPSANEVLVPLQINLLLDTYRLKETLVWNLADPRLTVERYAEEMCNDLDLPVERFGKVTAL